MGTKRLAWRGLHIVATLGLVSGLFLVDSVPTGAQSVGPESVVIANTGTTPGTPTGPKPVSARSSAEAGVATGAARPWTAQEMQAAKTYMPGLDPNKVSQVAAPAAPAVAGATNGLKGGATPGTAPGQLVTVSVPSPAYNLVPGGPYSYPAPTDNWQYFPRYTRYPISALGKLFFTIVGQGNFQCSASAIGPDQIITAGHCVAEPNAQTGPTYHTNMVFDPGYDYNQGGAPTTIGQFPVTNLRCYLTSNFSHVDWCFDGTTERDWGGGDTGLSTGCTNCNGRHLGQVTAALGFAWNFPVSQHWQQFGYPAQAPFNDQAHGFGGYIEQNSSSYAYSLDDCVGCDSPDNFAVGSRNNGGSSGGPFILGFGDLNVNNGGVPCCNYINGLHSFTRLGEPNDPNDRYHEMGSPYLDGSVCGFIEQIRHETTYIGTAGCAFPP